MRLLGALLLLIAAIPAIAAEERTCLVLSGGGARGIAHVGVLKVLERNRIPIDCIIGTSMGSVAGSLYAAGLSAAEIEAAVGEVDWGGLFFDQAERQHRSLREKSEDRGFLVRAVLGLRGGRLALPQGVFQGQRLGLALRGLQVPVAGVEDFDQLPIPFRAVTADVGSGQAVVLGEGDLSRAVRASMAVPGVFSPVEIDGRRLVDGGVAKNLPIDEAIALGATRIIAVDISSPLKPPEELLHSLAISEQMLAALMLRETQRQVERLGPDDVLLRPELGDLSSTDFGGAADIAVAAGEAAAEEALPALQDLALDEAAWSAWEHRRRRRVHELGPVREVRIDNRSRMADATVRKLLPQHPPVPPDREVIEAAVDRLYGTGEFAHVDYSLRRDDAGDTVLTYRLIDRDWDTTGLRFGLRLEDNFAGSSNFQLAVRLRQRKINTLGGEWLALVQVGKIGMLATEWYQPLDYGRRWFFRPRLEFQVRNQPFLANGERDLELQLRRRGVELRTELGRNLGNEAEVHAGPLLRRTRYTPRRGGQEDEEGAFYLTMGGFSAGLLVDTLDDVVFPGSGWWLEVAHRRYLERWSSIDDASVTDYALGRAFSAGSMRFVLSVDGRYASDLFAPEEVAFLGGFQRLSGLAEDELFGRISVLGRLVALQPLRRSSRFPIYAGVTLEAGNTFLDSSDIRGSSLITAGSLFLGARTPLGPIYLGGGLAEGGERSVYLFVGQPF